MIRLGAQAKTCNRTRTHSHLESFACLAEIRNSAREFTSSAHQSPPAKTIDDMIVDHSRRLHVGVTDR